METLFKPTGVIVADDDPLIRSILREKLGALGQEVFLANNGLEAVAIAYQMRALLVILDIGMPRLDGIQACVQIRELPGYASTPIVMLTFDDTARAQSEASRAGATMFLAKPFGSATLMLALSRFLPMEPATREAIRQTAIQISGRKAFTKMRS